MDRDAELKQARGALDAAEAKYPPEPKVHGYELELYVESSGDDAVLVTVIVEDQPVGRIYSWRELEPIRDAIVAQFREETSRQAYVDFRSRSDYERGQATGTDDTASR